MEHWNNFVKTTFFILTLKHRYPLPSPLMTIPLSHPTYDKVGVLATVQHVSDTPTPTLLSRTVAFQTMTESFSWRQEHLSGIIIILLLVVVLVLYEESLRLAKSRKKSYLRS